MLCSKRWDSPTLKSRGLMHRLHVLSQANHHVIINPNHADLNFLPNDNFMP